MVSESKQTELLTLAGTRPFAILDGTGEGMRPPLRFQNKCLRAYREWPADCSLWVMLAIGGAACLTLGQNLTQPWDFKGQIFPKSAIFHVYKPISGKVLLTMSKRNLRHRVFHSILRRMTYCFGILIKYLRCRLVGRPGRKQRHRRQENRPRANLAKFLIERSSWLTSETVKKPYNGFVLKMNHIFGLRQNLKKSPNHQFTHYV